MLIYKLIIMILILFGNHLPNLFVLFILILIVESSLRILRQACMMMFSFTELLTTLSFNREILNAKLKELIQLLVHNVVAGELVKQFL